MSKRRFPSEYRSFDGQPGIRDANRAEKNTPQVWVQNQQPLLFSAATLTAPGGPLPVGGGVGSMPFGFMHTAQWDSAFFDLRPDLRSTSGTQKVGVPMWEDGARLFVSLLPTQNNVTPSLSFQNPSLRIQASNWYSIDNMDRLPVAPGGGPLLEIMDEVVDVTDQFQSPDPGGVQFLGIFNPPGSTAQGGGKNHPIRYWMLRLRFNMWFPDAGTYPVPPPLTRGVALKAGLY